MQIETSRFGTVNIKESDVLEILDGVMGFPEDEEFVILDHDSEEHTPFQWLQSVTNPKLAFVVIAPRLLQQDYTFEIDEKNAGILGSASPGDFQILVIVKIPPENPSGVTANLRAPILLHTETRKGLQIVLSNEEYPFAYPVLSTTAAAAGS